MPKVESVDAFVQKWEPSILDALITIGNAVHRAGYEAALPDGDIDYPPQLRWLMRTWYPTRPISMESMDMIVAFTIVQYDPDSSTFLPFIEVFNLEGSLIDDINISEPLLLDDEAWEGVIKIAQGKADHVVSILEEYFPKPTKRIWKIHVTAPGNIKLHPSVHSDEEIAKEDVSIRLAGMLDRLSRLFWEMEAVRMYSAWTSSSTYAISQVRTLLDQGDVWEALRKYHQFVDSLAPTPLDRVTKAVGTLRVERLGGYPGEEDY